LGFKSNSIGKEVGSMTGFMDGCTLGLYDDKEVAKFVGLQIG
jgi:hypothetical protein